MAAFLRWLRSTFVSVLNGVARLAAFLVLLLLVMVVITLARGDGMPGNMVLALDLRGSLADSTNGQTGLLVPQPVTVMDLLLALENARKDGRVKGVTLRIGDGGVSLSQAEEIAPSLAGLRRAGKFVLVHATGFNSTGLGDLVAASAGEAIWMQPKAHFAPSGAALSEIFLRGLLDKIEAQPQIARRAEYKSYADTFMEKSMTAPDREQLTALAQSAYDSGVAAIAAQRRLSPDQVRAALDRSPQLAEDALAAHLIDHIGYDDEMEAQALARAGAGAKSIKIKDYIRSRDNALSAPIALVEASGEIGDGTAGDSLFGGNQGIYGDDLSAAISQAAKDPAVKAILLRVDSPGGSVSASDQILHAVKAAQAKGKKVVVSMGALAASGGYYISLSADRIVAEPGTITGSIGVVTGKVSVGKSLGLIGVTAGEVSVGRNANMDSPVSPYNDEQWAAVNREADAVYADFTQKVAAGRKLPLAQVQAVAKGRVWSGADAKAHGLVDELGGFWTAARIAARLGGVSEANTRFKVYPRRTAPFSGLRAALDGVSGTAESLAQTLAQVQAILGLPGVRQVVQQAADAPRGGVQLLAPAFVRHLGSQD